MKIILTLCAILLQCINLVKNQYPTKTEGTESVIFVVNKGLKKIDYKYAKKKTESIIDKRFNENAGELKYLKTSHDNVYDPVSINERYYPTIFHAVEYAYSNHLSLEFDPDDWLQAINFKISRDIKKISEEEEKSGKKEIRKLFVRHEGKKNITVKMSQVDYLKFINEVADKIQDDIKVPELAAAMKSDFTTSTNIDEPISSICLANAMSHFYQYELLILCGINSVKLGGSEDDWKALVQKVQTMGNILKKPLAKLGYKQWFKKLKKITKNLLKTYQSAKRGESTMSGWWKKIFSRKSIFTCGRETSFDGWIFDLANINLPYIGDGLLKTGILGNAISKVDFVLTNLITGTKAEMNICGGVVGYNIKNDTVSLVKAVAVYQKSIENLYL